MLKQGKFKPRLIWRWAPIQQFIFNHLTSSWGHSVDSHTCNSHNPVNSSLHNLLNGHQQIAAVSARHLVWGINKKWYDVCLHQKHLCHHHITNDGQRLNISKCQGPPGDTSSYYIISSAYAQPLITCLWEILQKLLMGTLLLAKCRFFKYLQKNFFL